VTAGVPDNEWTADYAVVGGGIVGVLAAREIAARNPGADVVLLDKDAVGSGASRRSAGLHFPRGASAVVRRMSAQSQYFYEGLARRRPELPIHPVPMLVLSRAGTQELTTTYLHLEPAGPDALPGPPCPRLTLPPDGRVWSCAHAHRADVGDLTRALAAELSPRVRLREGVRVVSLDSGPRGVRLGLGSGAELTADRVLLCPGPWVHEPAWRSLTASAGLAVKKVVALHLDVRPEPGAPAVVFHDDDAFLLPLPDRWLFSYTSTRWGVDPDGAAVGLDPHDVAEALSCLRRWAPDLAGVPFSCRVLSGRVFSDAYSADRIPLVRTLDDHGRVVFAGAANGSGYRLAPAIADQAAALLELPIGVGTLL